MPETSSVIYLVAVGYPDKSPVREGIDAGMSEKYYLMTVMFFTFEILR
jgi:hypothetical protein